MAPWIIVLILAGCVAIALWLLLLLMDGRRRREAGREKH
jgi:hypothetical protein